MSKVADKYRPIDPTPTTRSRPWPLVGAVVGLVVLGGLWSSKDLLSLVSVKESLPVHSAWLWTAQTTHAVSTATGIARLREGADALAAPLQRTPRILARTAPDLPVEPIATLVEDTDPPDPQAPPGAGWIGPADEGGQRVQRMVLVGASSMQYYLGTELERRLEAEYPGMSVHRLGKLGTGLVRQDVFDWPATIRALLADHKPQVVVIQLGGNDAQPITVDGKRISYGREGWAEEYQKRMGGILRDIRASGATAIVLGMPVMRDPGFSDRMRRMNETTRVACEAEGARYVETWDLVSNDDGSYRVEVAFAGKRARMRLQDGIHYSRLGAQYLADRLIDRLEQEVPLVQAAPASGPAPAVALRQVSDSGLRYLAYVPRTVPEAGLPAALIVKSDAQPWNRWADSLHAQTQLRATSEGRILILVDGSEAPATTADDVDVWAGLRASAEAQLPIAGWESPSSP